MAEIKGIEIVHVARNHHHIVGRLVIDHQRIVAVIDKSAGGVDGFAQKGIVIGIVLITVVLNLKPKQPAQVYDCDNENKPSYHIFTFLKLIVFAHLDGREVIGVALQIRRKPEL